MSTVTHKGVVLNVIAEQRDENGVVLCCVPAKRVPKIGEKWRHLGKDVHTVVAISADGRYTKFSDGWWVPTDVVHDNWTLLEDDMKRDDVVMDALEDRRRRREYKALRTALGFPPPIPDNYQCGVDPAEGRDLSASVNGTQQLPISGEKIEQVSFVHRGSDGQLYQCEGAQGRPITKWDGSPGDPYGREKLVNTLQELQDQIELGGQLMNDTQHLPIVQSFTCCRCQLPTTGVPVDNGGTMCIDCAREMELRR